MPTAGKKLNIIVVNDYQDVNGGASKIAVAEAVGLAEKGHTVSFFCAVAGVSTELPAAGVKVICLHQHDILHDENRCRAVSQGLWNWKAAREFDKLLGDCDRGNTLIHLHSWTKALSSSIVRKAITRGFSVVCTMHDYFLACPNGGFFHYGKSEICPLKALSAKCLLTDCDNRSYMQKCWRIARQVVQKQLGMLPAGINNFIAVSRFSREILQPYLTNTANIWLVDNPIAMEKFLPVNIANNEQFIYIGRISAEKGCLLFAAAVNQLAVPACFIGDGELRKRVLKIAPGSTVTGWLQHEQLFAAMQSARALVFPSQLYETQGLVVREAMARGIPVIVADTSAASEMVEDGVTGFCFKGGALCDLVEVMKKMSAPGVAEKMGQAAYDSYWAAPFTLERHVGQLEVCYGDILARRQALN